MPLETSELNQRAVLWAASGTDNYGEHTVNAATEIAARWESGLAEAVGAQGAVIASSGTVVVDREIAVGSILWKGKLCDVPTPKTNLHQVIDYQETPDVKARNYRRVVTLARYSDELPGIV